MESVCVARTLCFMLLANNTELKIIVQPVDKFRFRYKSEMMGTHGSLLGEREETSHKKEVPTAQVFVRTIIFMPEWSYKLELR